MRIVGGSARGRRLFAPRDRTIRPTADKVKEAVFNILTVLLGGLEGKIVLDLFAGTGGMGIEALSRGADRVVFVDSGREASRLVARNLDATGFVDRARVETREVISAIALLEQTGTRFDLIILDPPYAAGLTDKVLNRLADSLLLSDETLVVAEFSSREKMPTEFGPLREFDRRLYGDTAVSFLRTS